MPLVFFRAVLLVLYSCCLLSAPLASNWGLHCRRLDDLRTDYAGIHDVLELGGEHDGVDELGAAIDFEQLHCGSDLSSLVSPHLVTHLHGHPRPDHPHNGHVECIHPAKLQASDSARHMVCCVPCRATLTH
jgi:hypothetical protein